MKRSLIIILSIISFFNLYGQDDNNRLKVLVSSRVDTSSNEIKDIINLYENYLNSQPDSIYDNPFWNKKEKEMYKDFDFSRSSIFQGEMTTKQLVEIFNPFVMSIEPLGEKYQIRILFSSPTIDPKYAGSKVWCIQKLNVKKENDNWVLENLIVDLSENWSTKTCGVVEYIYPPTHSFNARQAKLAKQFCKSIIKRFNPTFDKSFKYYVTSSIDEMGLLENFDYYFVGITTGKTRENMIISAKGNENYPHEFVHKILPENHNRSYVIEEGLAVFLGTKENAEEYKLLLSKLSNDLKSNSEKINFVSVVSEKVRFNGYQTAYPAGAALCEVVFNYSGDDGLLQLIASDTSSYAKLISVICEITGLTFDEFVQQWNDIVSSV